MNKLLPLIFLIICCFGCSKDEDIKPDPKNITVEEGQEKYTGSVELPSSIDPQTLSVTSTSGSYELYGENEFTIAKNKIDKQFLFVEDQNGEVMLAKYYGDDGELINARTTARAIIALAPWTAYVEEGKLKEILDEISQMEEFNKLHEAVQLALENGISPLNNEGVQSAFQVLNKAIISSETSSPNDRTTIIPEVDYLVEPSLSFSNKTLTIRNDGTTTAAWGVEVFHEGTSITDNLILPGNSVSFPSLSSIWAAITGNTSDAVFKSGPNLEIPLPLESKYPIKFGSPTSSNLMNSSLSMEAAYYNIAVSHAIILKSFGIEIPTLEISNIFDQGCLNEVFDATSNVIVDAINADKLTTEFYLDHLTSLFKSSSKSMAACTDMFSNFPGSSTTAKEVYLKKLVSFLNLYAKSEAVFITSKLFGDMFVLNDISICRQVINGKIYPCFSLIKNEEIETETIYQDDEINLDVKGQLDFPSADNTTFPNGMEVHWEVTEGDGKLSSDKSNINTTGLAKIRFTAGKEARQTIKSSIKNSKGEDIDFINYTLYVREIDSTAIYEKAVVGNWSVYGINEGITDPNPGNLELYEGGIGRYIVEGPNSPNRDGTDENGNSFYNVSWEIYKRDGRYFLSESGFWHYGFESYRTYDVNLKNNALTYPLNFHITYNEFDDGPYPSRKYVKN
ncbi:hypothetical protein KZP23_13740 [Echinicola marina]|uniref:hypothetical protein n=1 Tax=Echinicola marina TaxID=2859768 RepID=UPI001CF67523|nr:hypothetical protein [Echinicola marina]UCS91797.1 hypothetical protein KZP23_13740 [Echinicola marina]